MQYSPLPKGLACCTFLFEFWGVPQGGFLDALSRRFSECVYL